MNDLASNLLSVPKQILDFVIGVKKLQRDSADRTAALFRHIAATLAGVAGEIRQGRIPNGACGELRTFADEFSATTEGVLGRSKANSFAALLRANYNVEKFAASLSSDDARRETAAQRLEESSGRFMALAHIIRTKV